MILLYRIFPTFLAAVVLTPFAAIANDDEPPKPHNILLIIADDLRANVLDCYGDKICQTPNLDRLAQRSVVFTHAYCQSPLCGPSRPSFMFSRYGPTNIDPSIHKSFPQLMKENGWYSARVGKVFHMAVPGDIVQGSNGRDFPDSWTERFNCAGKEETTPGLYQCLNTNDIKRSLKDRQGAKTKNRMYVAVQADGDGTSQPDCKAASKAIELLREHKEKPFVLAVGFVRPHYPHVAPAPLFEPYPFSQMVMPEILPGDWDDIPKAGIAKFTTQSVGLDKFPDNQKRMWSAYYASVTFMDQQLGKVLDELHRLELHQNTTVIFLSDHGYHLGDHDFWQKQNLHEQAIRVPLMIASPGIAAATCDSVVELTDIYPTVTDLVGLKTPASCRGVSLKSALEHPEQKVRDFAFTFVGPKPYRRFSIRGEKWAYIKYEKGEELYDMQTDYDQFHNLASKPPFRSELVRLRAEVNRRAAVFSSSR